MPDTESHPASYQKHEVPLEYLTKWQEAIDVLASIYKVPAGLIMRVLPQQIEVLISSRRENNPYEPGEKANLKTGLYCETVMSSRDMLHVPNALKDPDWKDNPDVDLNMISYIGMPLIWPDNTVFGTVCVLDEQELNSNADYIQLIKQFKDMIERDFQMLKRNEDLETASRELAEARELADRANSAKSAFLANMSHELRTPMNAIIGYSELLMEEAADTDQEDSVPDLLKIHQAGNHLLSLINSVLDLSKIEAGRMEVFAEDFDVAVLLDQVVGTVQPLIEKNNNRFVLLQAPDLGNVHQDATKLRQSLLNLLSNAAKFTKDGTITLNAERESQSDGEWLNISVSDTGIGIPADKLDEVFVEFSQAEASTTRDHGGTGLGLPISERFCRMLGGDVGVSSILGEGSTFTIRIPAICPTVDATESALK